MSFYSIHLRTRSTLTEPDIHRPPALPSRSRDPAKSDLNPTRRRRRSTRHRTETPRRWTSSPIGGASPFEMLDYIFKRICLKIYGLAFLIDLGFFPLLVECYWIYDLRSSTSMMCVGGFFFESTCFLSVFCYSLRSRKFLPQLWSLTVNM